MIRIEYLDKGKPGEILSTQSHGSSLPPHSAKVPKTAGLPRGLGGSHGGIRPDRQEVEGMRKSMIVLVLVLVGALGAWSVAAQDCSYLTFKMDSRSAAPIVPPLGDYDFCAEITKIVGGIKGRYEWCLYSADVELLSDDIFSDGISTVGPGRYYSRIETDDGELQLEEWTWGDLEFGTEIGMAKVMGGTGTFENYSGILYEVFPRFPVGANHLFLQYEGYICAPE